MISTRKPTDTANIGYRAWTGLIAINSFSVLQRRFVQLVLPSMIIYVCLQLMILLDVITTNLSCARKRRFVRYIRDSIMLLYQHTHE